MVEGSLWSTCTRTHGAPPRPAPHPRDARPPGNWRRQHDLGRSTRIGTSPTQNSILNRTTQQVCQWDKYISDRKKN